MEININQKKIAIGEKYKIEVDGLKTYTAASKIFRFLPEIHLLEQGNDRPRFIVEKKFSFFKTSFELTRWDNNKFEFRTKNFLKRHYYCQVGADYYEIFGHRGRKYSVYKNAKQIAWWDKNAVVWFEGDNYKIVADKDIDAELLISFCLAVDNKSERKSSAITWDIGSIGPQVKKFDANWQPKY